uniref:Expressed protein n=1 Tax=Echinococcus granulosus TaxID=6210 RepID=A0A068W9B3_ECHGR|nr:expressed protein [Echinococcus granulosus]
MARRTHLANFFIPLLSVFMLQLMSSLPRSTMACKEQFNRLRETVSGLDPCNAQLFPFNILCKLLRSVATKLPRPLNEETPLLKQQSRLKTDKSLFTQAQSNLPFLSLNLLFSPYFLKVLFFQIISTCHPKKTKVDFIFVILWG